MKTRIRRVRLRIRYKRRSDLVALAAMLTLVLTTAVFLGPRLGQKKATADAQASPVAFTRMRRYYLTQSEFQGDETLTACASGYHMASLWEILDPSNLEYDTDLGFTRADSGAGPPGTWMDIRGWVRTGWDIESPPTYIAGRDNCLAWTNGSSYVGTVAWLPNDWIVHWDQMHAWEVDTYPCYLPRRVWCVEDYGSSGYLPLVLKD